MIPFSFFNILTKKLFEIIVFQKLVLFNLSKEKDFTLPHRLFSERDTAPFHRGGGGAVEILQATSRIVECPGTNLGVIKTK